LFLSDKIEGDAEQGYIFKVTHGYYSFSHKIIIAKNKQVPETTTLKIVYFYVGRYNLKSSPEFFEEATKISLYLKEVLRNRKPNLFYAVDVEFTNEAEDSLIDNVIDGMRGYYVKTKRFSKADWFRIGAIITIAIVAGVLFASEQPTYGTLTAILDALITISQLPDLLKQQS
jgi:hypothetical protein